MPLRTLCCLVLALAVAPLAAAPPSTPEATLAAFYARVLSPRSGGLPSVAGRARLAGVLTPDLLGLLERAATVQATCLRTAAKDEKPLMLEGDLFTGNYEGATEVAYGEVRRDGERAVAEARLMYVTPSFPKGHRHRAVAWTDRVELRSIDGRWRVSDVRSGGDRSLVAALGAFIDEGQRTCRKP